LLTNYIPRIRRILILPVVILLLVGVFSNNKFLYLGWALTLNTLSYFLLVIENVINKKPYTLNLIISVMYLAFAVIILIDN
jgi:hypothetical protein